MSTSSVSSSPSSSSVTIPIPGKSILKRPPPTQQSLFSRIIKILPSQTSPSGPDDETKTLKRAHFILPEIAVVYPISSLNPPSVPGLKEEKRAIEEKELERRKRVVRGDSISGSDADDWWSMDKVESFYRECCASREEEPDPAVSAAFKNAVTAPLRTVDLSGVQLTPATASILSDVFTIEWGLRKLVLRECNLDEQTLKPILHALLIPGTLTFLSVSSNHRMKAPAYKLLSAYLAKAKSLQFLDLTQNALDKKAIEFIVTALPTAPNLGILSLKLDDCSLRPAALETLAHVVRTSSLRHISLRHNRIAANGAVALALMTKDYPDIVPGTNSNTSPTSSVPSSPSTSNINLPMSPPSPLPPPSPITTGPGSPTASTSTSSPRQSISARLAALQPPPRHPALNGPQTTYTPYIPRSKRGLPPPPPSPAVSGSGQPVPIITSSSQGGVTTRHPVPAVGAGSGSGSQQQQQQQQPHETLRTPLHAHGPSAALLDNIRALDNLPRLGALRTLDLRGNDLRAGISYLAQVLKRNRTLKVLNLSENKLDVQCLVAVAEALKYNSCLETLDLSKNPCSGPGLEGIQSLRTAFTLNTALKRLFLSSTSMTSAGAIALAEFLPESSSLLHLDLTDNNLDFAGVMALSSGLKSNHVMRCLDLNIPPGDEQYAKMCRDILNTCVRNTEEAEKRTQDAAAAAASSSSSAATPTGADGSDGGRGHGKGVWGLIEDSQIARSIRKDEEKQIRSDIIVQARSFLARLTELSNAPVQLMIPPSHEADDMLKKGNLLHQELTSSAGITDDPARLQELLEVNDLLTAALARQSQKQHQQRRSARRPPGLGISAPGVEGYFGNGDVVTPPEKEEEAVVEEEIASTPRIDKGKGKAPPEHEPVLSPTAAFLDDSDEDEVFHSDVETEDEMAAGAVASPTDRSKSWVAEEGEIFRKGNVLLGPEEMEGEYAGEDLRRELLEAMVERPPPRPVLDDFGIEVQPSPIQDIKAPESPQESAKPPPRPYISRSRSSSSSILQVMSPTSANGRSPTSPIPEAPPPSS